MSFEKKEYQQRIRKVRHQLRTLNVHSLIVTGVENVRYLTGFTGHDSWALLLPRSVVLITDSRYTEQAQGEGVNCRIIERKGGLAKEAEKILSKQTGISLLGIEDSCSVAMLKAVRKSISTKIKPVTGIVESIRAIKSDGEIKLIRKAGKIAFEAMDSALKQLKVGMTERQLAALYEYNLSQYNANPSFETIAAFGPNGSRNHHQPGPRKLKKIDTVLLDFGASYQGYCSDITRCYAVGKVTPFFKEAYKTVAESQRSAIKILKHGPEELKEGVKGSHVDTVARAVIQATDFPVYGHGLGHGLGLEVHETPRLSNMDKKTILQSGHVVTIEPGVYLPGKFGIRLEDDVLVTKEGARILTRDKRFDIDPETVPLLKV